MPTGQGIKNIESQQYLFKNGNSFISWSSRKQSTVALSLTEAEYVAASYAIQEVLWLCQLLMDLNQAQQGPTTLYEDNQGCIKLALQEKHSARTKHIDVTSFPMIPSRTGNT